MLSLIIPPIILAVSVITLILFVLRKIKTIPEPSDHDLVHVHAIHNYVKTINVSRIQHFFLAALEKTAQRFKVLSLRFHNHLDHWFQSLKEKRRKSKELMEKHRELSEEHRTRLSGLIRKKEKPSEANISEEQPVKRTPVVEIPRPALPVIEKKPMPMISRIPTVPEVDDAQLEARKKLEELLIERIATDPRDIEAYERLGDYYIEQRNFVDAKECYKQVLRLSPINRKARMRMRNIERELGK